MQLYLVTIPGRGSIEVPAESALNALCDVLTGLGLRYKDTPARVQPVSTLRPGAHYP